MCPAVPTITLFVSVGIDGNARRLVPPWMLLEERICGQTVKATLRRQSLPRWTARRRADRARQEWGGPRRENRRRRESLPSALLYGPDRPARRTRFFLSDVRRESQSGS